MDVLQDGVVPAPVTLHSYIGIMRTLVVCMAPSLHLMTRSAKSRIERATYGLNTWYVLRLSWTFH